MVNHSPRTQCHGTCVCMQLVAGLDAVPYSVMKAFVERLDPAIMCEMAMMSVFKVGCGQVLAWIKEAAGLEQPCKAGVQDVLQGVQDVLMYLWVCYSNRESCFKFKCAAAAIELKAFTYLRASAKRPAPSSQQTTHHMYKIWPLWSLCLSKP